MKLFSLILFNNLAFTTRDTKFKFPAFEEFIIHQKNYSVLNWQKRVVFLIIAYVFSSTKLEIRADQVLPGSKGVGEGRGGGGGQGGEMTKTMYAPVTK
jgi:hypothetical protein